MSIHLETTLPASPARVYAALLDGAQFTAVTGGRAATIGTGPGAEFSLFGGAIHGRHVELVPDERIVQAWRVKMWEPGGYSLVRFALAPAGTGTRLVVDHTGYPEEQKEHLTAGWSANYFEPLAKFFA
jgi:activator of HSP90 ATPase